MKEVHELGLGTADVAAITGKAIAKTIEEVARGETKFAQLYRVNKDLMADGTPPQIQFPKKGTGIAVTWGAAPGASIAPSSFSYDAVTVQTVKSGVRLEFTNEALKQALRDVIKDHIYEAGLVYAETIDDVAMSTALGLTPQTLTITTGSIGTLTNAPVVKIVSVTGGTILNVEYDTGKVVLAASVPACTVVAQYAAVPKGTGLWVGATTPGSLTAKDVSRAKAKMVTNHRYPDVLLFNDADYASLLFDPNMKFVDVSAYGDREPVLNGEIGKALGMKVLTSSRIPQGNAVLVDSKRLGYDVHRRELSGVREDKPEFDSVWYHFWAERNFGLTDSFAVALVCNAQAPDYVYPAA